jgi:hypothetical protein
MKRSVLIFLVFSVISFVATLLPRYLERSKSLQELRSVRLEQEQEAKRKLSDPNYRNDLMLQFIRSQVEEIERLKNSLGSESEIVLDPISEIVKEMISAYSEYENAVIKIFAILEFKAINSPEDIGKSIVRAKQAEIAANRMCRLNKEMGTKLKEFLVGSQESPSNTNSPIRGFYQTADIERKNELYKMNAEVMKEAQLVLQVLKKEWGTWEYNEGEGGVIFESEIAVSKFNSTMEQIGVLVQKVKELQFTILRATAGDGD